MLAAAAGLAAILWAFVTIAREARQKRERDERTETVERVRLAGIADRMRIAQRRTPLALEAVPIVEKEPKPAKRRLRTLVDELGEWHPDTAAVVPALLFNETAQDWAALGRFRTITPAVFV
jgi:hypothetical protein